MIRLTEVLARSAKPGTYCEEGGLMLRVGTDRWRRWTWRGTVNGKQIPIDFGHYPKMKVKEARFLAQGFHIAASKGMSPEDLGWPPGPMFERVAEALMEDIWPIWTEAKPGSLEAEVWDVLRERAYPRIGKVLIGDITKWHVMWCLDPIWWNRPDEAKRLLHWMNLIFVFARDSGYIRRTGLTGLTESHITHCMNRVVRYPTVQPAGK